MPPTVFVHNLQVGDPPDECELAAFPVQVVPFALAALEERTKRYMWYPNSYRRGVQLVRSLQLAILCGGMKELLESNDRLYRMLDTAIYGVGYTVESVDPLVVTPEIPPQRTMGIYSDDSILGRMENVKQMLDNALNGASTENYAHVPGIRSMLEDMLAATQDADTIDADMLAKLAEIALAVL